MHYSFGIGLECTVDTWLEGFNLLKFPGLTYILQKLYLIKYSFVDYSFVIAYTSRMQYSFVIAFLLSRIYN